MCVGGGGAGGLRVNIPASFFKLRGEGLSNQ